MAVNKVIYGGNTLVDLTGDTVTAADLADGVKATGADGNPVVGIMQKVTIDAELSTTSTNPVQNKVIKAALDGKLGKNAAAASANKLNTNGGSATQPIYFANGVPVATTYTLGKSVPSDAKFTDTVYNHPSTHPASMITGLSTVATSGSYNDLTNKPTIVKSVNNVTPDSNGNVTITVSGGGGVSTSEVNTWTAEQIFNDVTISGLEKSEPVILNGNSITPTSGYTVWKAKINDSSSLCTLNLDGLLAKANKISRFKILLAAGGSKVAPTLKITSTNNDITIFYPVDIRCSKWFSVVHVIIFDTGIQDENKPVLIKIDNFDVDAQSWGDITP